MTQVAANRTDAAHASTGQAAPAPQEAELPLSDRAFKLALVQCAPVLGDRAKNLATNATGRAVTAGPDTTARQTAGSA